MIAPRCSRLQPCVYVIAARDFRVKVGVTALLPRRLAQLIASERELLSVVRTFDFPTMRAARRVESEVKQVLAARKIEGEWFDVTRGEMVAAANDASRRIAANRDTDNDHIGTSLNIAASRTINAVRVTRRSLGWTGAELARRAKVSHATIRNLERGVTDPQVSTLKAILASFSEAGIQFVDGGDTRPGGRGVRFRA